MQNLASIPLKWPSDPRIRKQIEMFVEELGDSSRVHAAFLSAFIEDLDGEGTEREDLGEIVRARLHVRGTEVDAVATAYELFLWLRREILPAAVDTNSLPEMDSIADGSAFASALSEFREAAADAWHEKYHEEHADFRREWAAYQTVEHAQSAAKNLSSIARRLNPTRYREKLRRGDRPIDICERVAYNAGASALYAITRQPTLTGALHRLAEPDYARAGVARRAREALYATGLTDFGPELERIAVALVERYEALTLRGPVTPSAAVAAAEQVQPSEHVAAVAVVESPQLTARPIPPTARTFSAAAAEVVARALAEVATHIHSQAPMRGP